MIPKNATHARQIFPRIIRNIFTLSLSIAGKHGWRVTQTAPLSMLDLSELSYEHLLNIHSDDYLQATKQLDSSYHKPVEQTSCSHQTHSISLEPRHATCKRTSHRAYITSKSSRHTLPRITAPAISGRVKRFNNPERISGWPGTGVSNRKADIFGEPRAG